MRLAGAAGSIDLPQAMFSVGGAAKQVATNGTGVQVEKAAEIPAETRKRLYQLLAE